MSISVSHILRGEQYEVLRIKDIYTEFCYVEFYGNTAMVSIFQGKVINSLQ